MGAAPRPLRVAASSSASLIWCSSAPSSSTGAACTPAARSRRSPSWAGSAPGKRKKLRTIRSATVGGGPIAARRASRSRARSSARPKPATRAAAAAA
jgi:hypothetical protein